MPCFLNLYFWRFRWSRMLLCGTMQKVLCLWRPIHFDVSLKIKDFPQPSWQKRRPGQNGSLVFMVVETFLSGNCPSSAQKSCKSRQTEKVNLPTIEAQLCCIFPFLMERNSPMASWGKFGVSWCRIHMLRLGLRFSFRKRWMHLPSCRQDCDIQIQQRQSNENPQRVWWPAANCNFLHHDLSCLLFVYFSFETATAQNSQRMTNHASSYI